MKYQHAELALWGTTILLALVALRSLRNASIPPTPPNAPRTAALFHERSSIADTVRAAGQLIATHDPFRVTREPPAVPYCTSPLAAAPPAPRPNLTLRGIVGAAGHWSAIVTGIPGRDGSVVLQAGDTAGGLRVRRVSASAAVIAGADTTWTLKIGNPWP